MPGSNTPKNAKPRNPRIAIHDRQKKHPLRLPRLRRQAEAAAAILARRLPAHLDTVEVTLLTPAAIGRIHGNYLGDPAPTDVITFEHGEILVCPAVAEQQRPLEGLSLHDEVLTYILHGLLHLCGMDDHSPRDFSRMQREQDRLRKLVHPVR